MKYTLTLEEQKEVLDLIKNMEIDENNGNYFRRNPVDKKQSKKEAQEHGLGAEVAFCKIVGVPYDLSLHKKCVLIDAIVNGQNVDVKQTKYLTGKLLVKETDVIDTPINVYALVTGEFPNYNYCGWAYKDELVQEKNIKNLGYKNSNPYCLEQSVLHKEEIHG